MKQDIPGDPAAMQRWNPKDKDRVASAKRAKEARNRHGGWEKKPTATPCTSLNGYRGWTKAVEGLGGEKEESLLPPFRRQKIVKIGTWCSTS